MQLIKNKQVAQDQWRYIADEESLETDYSIISLLRWQGLKGASPITHLGLRLESEVVIEEMVKDLSHFQLIELFLPVYTDGRAFTQARLLRSRYGFQGDIRVSGHFMRDQVGYFHSVGVSSFELSETDNLPEIIQSMNELSVAYQSHVA